MYCGALAAFKLWGDCELARQYLSIAVDRNPNVLIKILGRVKIPGKHLSLEPFDVFSLLDKHNRGSRQQSVPRCSWN